MNADRDWLKIPECQLAGVMTEIITRILGLRAKYGTQKQILLQKMDVKIAFRQVGVAPDRAAAFAYRLEDLVFVDLRLQFGWRGSPGGGGGNERNPRSPSDDDVGVAELTRKAVEPSPPGCRAPKVRSGAERDPRG